VIDEDDECYLQDLDGYNFIELWGKGGFSKVYRVSPKGLSKSFALKYVKDKKYLPLLKAEAQILAKLNHPQIPSPFKLVEEIPASRGGGAYLVMDFVPNNLQNLLDENESHTLPLNKTLEIAEQLLKILQYTHSQGVVHKDLKPRNIGLDDYGNVILFDFNIAKILVKAGPETNSNLQQSSLESQIVQIGDVQRSLLGGTEGYRSPEQRKLKINGKIYPVDERSDIFTLGILIYEMLVGFLPDGNYKKPSQISAKRWGYTHESTIPK